MVEHDDPLGAALGFDQRFHLRIVDPLDLGLVEEVGNLGVVTNEAEAVALEREVVRVRTAVVNDHAARIGRAAGARVAAAGTGDDSEDLVAVIDDVIERRFDGVGGDVELSGVSHGKLP